MEHERVAAEALEDQRADPGRVDAQAGEHGVGGHGVEVAEPEDALRVDAGRAQLATARDDQPQARQRGGEAAHQVDDVLHGARSLELHLLERVEEEDQPRAGDAAGDLLEPAGQLADQPVEVQLRRVELEQLGRQPDVGAGRGRLDRGERAPEVGVRGVQEPQLAGDLLEQPARVARVVARLVEVDVGERHRALADPVLELEQQLAEQRRLARPARAGEHEQRVARRRVQVRVEVGELRRRGRGSGRRRAAAAGR